MTPFTVANKIFILRFLPFSLLIFEIAYVHASSVSQDELNVPYVPYVVVDKNKDEFDYERLQETIVKYLENRSQRQSYNPETSTSFYDYLRTSSSPSLANDHVHYGAYQQPTSTPYNYPNENQYSSPKQQPELQTTSSRTSGPSVYQQLPQQVADTRSISVYPFGISDIHPAYYSSVFKPGTKIKDSSEVTANVKVTTFQPHRYLTTPLNSVSYVNVSSRYRPDLVRYPSFVLETATPKFVPLKTSFVSSQFADSIGSESYNINEDFPNFNKFPSEGEKKCSLKSSRYVFDGGCVSKKPVVETVCADRCIKYEVFDGTKKPFYVDAPYKPERQMSAGEKKRKAIALTCKDGDVKKQKIKLYCKDGTILNNVIRIVNNCICQEHSEKVHTTKRSHKYEYVNPRLRMMSRPPMKVRVRG